MPKYIDRDKLLEHVKNLPTWWADAGGFYPDQLKYPDGMFYPEDVISSIENAQSEDVAPVVHGHWIEDGWFFDVYDDPDYDAPWTCYSCSECGGLQDVRGQLPPKFCSACGALMDGEIEN